MITFACDKSDVKYMYNVRTFLVCSFDPIFLLDFLVKNGKHKFHTSSVLIALLDMITFACDKSH